MLADFSEKFRLIRFCLILAFTLLVIPNLGTRPLWQDEAETALVARQMARAPFDGVNSNTWLPYAYDDQGPISQDWNYQFSVSPLWRWHPWLQFYVTALSFKLLGVSAFSARLPFAFLGIAAYWYFLNFLIKSFEGWRAREPRSSARSLSTCGRGRRSGVKPDRTPTKFIIFFLIAAILMLFSTPLLLHLRQARYYSLSLLFTLIAIDGYLDKNWKKYIVGSIFLFHSFLPGALALQISFFTHLLITKKLNSFFYFFRRFAITLLFTLPWAVWLKISGQNLNFSPELIKQHLLQHYSYIHKFIFPAFIFIPLISKTSTLKLLSKLANLRVRLLPPRLTGLPSEATPSTICHVRAGDGLPAEKRAMSRERIVPEGEWQVKAGERANFANEIANQKLIFFSIFISISLFLYTFNHPYFFRYLIPLIPLFIYIAAWIIASSKPILALIPLISLILMTAKTFPNYLFEITHPYRGANAEIIGFLSSLDPQKYQKLAVNYDDFTFRFHTSFTIYGAQQLENPRGVTGEGTPLERPQPEREYKSRARTSERGEARQDPDQANSCPDVVIIFPDWGNEEKLREISQDCQLAPYPLPLHYAKLGDDPDPTNHRFTPPPLRTLEVFLKPPSPS